MYDYYKEKEKLFTDEGQRKFLEVRDKVQCLLETAGAFTSNKAFEGITGHSFLMEACIDRLIELGEIELVYCQTETQHQVYIKTNK